MNMMREGFTAPEQSGTSLENPQQREIQRQRDYEKFSESLARDLPKRREALMKRKEAALVALDTEKPKPGQIVIHKEGKDLVYKDPRIPADKTKVTWGQIMTGAEWGIDYYLQPSFSKKERQAFLEQKFAIAEQELQHEEDLVQELTNRLSDESVARAQDTTTFRAIYREQYSPEARSKSESFHEQGILAEKMARVFLSRVGFDFPELHLKVEAVSPIDDVNKKVDFVVYHQTIPQDHENVKIREPGENDEQKPIFSERKLIQFTTNTQATEYKKHQAATTRGNREGEWLTIVSIDMRKIKELFINWERKKRDEKLFGPDELLPSTIKQTLFRDVMAGILKKEEIEATCAKL